MGDYKERSTTWRQLKKNKQKQKKITCSTFRWLLRNNFNNSFKHLPINVHFAVSIHMMRESYWSWNGIKKYIHKKCWNGKIFAKIVNLCFLVSEACFVFFQHMRFCSSWVMIKYLFRFVEIFPTELELPKTVFIKRCIKMHLSVCRYRLVIIF